MPKTPLSGPASEKPARGGGLSAAQVEIDSDRGLYFNRLSVQNVGPVLPLLHRIERRLHQHGMAAHHPQVFDVPTFTDNGVENHRALNARGFGQRWIRRLH